MSEGFELVTGDMTKKGELKKLVPEIETVNSLTDLVPRLIRYSAAFIQILPYEILEARRSVERPLNWLLFEFGAAQVLQLPCMILVDIRKASSDIGRWKEELKVGNDYPLLTFDSSSGPGSLYSAVRAAFQQLAIRLSGRSQL